MIPKFLRVNQVQVLNEAAAKTIQMTKEAIARYAAMKDKNQRPLYQFMQAGSTDVVSKGQDVDFYAESNGDKKYGIVQSVDAKSGIVKIKTKEGVVSVQGYPKGVIG